MKKERGFEPVAASYTRTEWVFELVRGYHRCFAIYSSVLLSLCMRECSPVMSFALKCNQN